MVSEIPEYFVTTLFDYGDIYIAYPSSSGSAIEEMSMDPPTVLATPETEAALCGFT